MKYSFELYPFARDDFLGFNVNMLERTGGTPDE